MVLNEWAGPAQDVAGFFFLALLGPFFFCQRVLHCELRIVLFFRAETDCGNWIEHMYTRVNGLLAYLLIE